MPRRGFKKYEVPQWIADSLQNLKPREFLKTSEWAERYRKMPSNNPVPGPWKNATTPYLVEIMDTFSSGEIEKVIFVKPTQVGGTAAMENMLASIIDQDPAPTMVVYPSEKLAERIVESKIMPMIEGTKILSDQFRKNESQKLELRFHTMTAYLNGANSPANLASTSIRYLFLDEVDKYPPASKKEADPVSLAIERTKTYTTGRAIFITSTPTVRSGTIWKQKEEADEERHFVVACPHCGEFIELKFAQIKWPKKEEEPDNRMRAERAVYICQKCGCIITDREKMQMLKSGKWMAVRKSSTKPKAVAFWMSTLYSPFTKFSDIAAEFMRCKNDSELHHNFTNSWLAEPWEDTAQRTSEETVKQRQTETNEMIVPHWAVLLTGGMDVQETCVYWTIRAWGEHMTSQMIAHGQARNMEHAGQIMNLEYERETGGKQQVELALMDSGDRTDEVYDFCADNADWVLPCKGTREMISHYRISKVNRVDSKAYGMQLVLVDVGKYKDMIASRMRRTNGVGSWMVHKNCDDDYAKQVTAEQKINEKSGSDTKKIWVKKSSHADNHYLDCEVYAAAAADMLDVRTLHLQTENDDEKSKVTSAKPRVETEENWISKNEW